MENSGRKVRTKNLRQNTQHDNHVEQQKSISNHGKTRYNKCNNERQK